MPEVVVFDNPKWRPSKRMLLTVIGGVIIVAVVGAGIMLWTRHSRQNQHYNSAMSEATSDSRKGEFSTALTILKGAVKYASNGRQKEQIYSSIVQNAITTGDMQSAEHYYMLEYQLDPTFAGQDAYVMATMYQLAGQKQQSIAQYKVSVQYLEHLKTTTSKSQTITYYNAEINAERSLLNQEEGQ